MKDEFYKFWLDVLRIGQRAVKKAQEENRQAGLPNVYTKNGKLYYELPDGTITYEQPKILSEIIVSKK
ncbi:MAG: hypothetical protein WCG27_06485 [Pseudomonadota bacterium]